MSNLNVKNLMHVIRAAAQVANDDEVIIFGSNAILPYLQDSSNFELSKDIDLTFWDDADERKTNAVDGAIGEGSTFHETFQYYAHGTAIDEKRIAPGWEMRATPLHVDDNIVGYVLSVPDLAACKLAAGRPKDLKFVEAILSQQLCAREEIAQIIDLLPEKRLEASKNFEFCKQRVDAQNQVQL